MNSKIKKLLGDTGLFALSNMGSKLIVLFMVPLYTSVLSDADYGIADLITSTNSLLVPLLTLSINEAVLRFLFDKSKRRETVLGNALGIALVSALTVALLSPILMLFDFELTGYWYWIPVIFTSTVINNIFSAYARGTNRIRAFALKGILQTLIMVCLNLVFLLVLKIGLIGYLLSIVLAELISTAFLIIISKIYKNELFTVRAERATLKQMLSYSIPMIPTVIAWWVMQLSDKYVVIAACGIAASGIYAVAYKIPTMLSTVTSIFTQAWQISAFENSEENDYSEFVSKIYRYFWIINTVFCAVLIAASKLLASFLYQKEFFEAWRYVPVLLIAYLFSGVSGFLASVFSAAKKTNVLFHSTTIGAILNLALNVVLVPLFGVMAAAFTTFIGFFATWLVRIYSSRKIVKIKITWVKDLSTFALLALSAVFTCLDFSYSIWISIAVVPVIILLYHDSLGGIIKGITKKNKGKR